MLPVRYIGNGAPYRIVIEAACAQQLKSTDPDVSGVTFIVDDKLEEVAANAFAQQRNKVTVFAILHSERNGFILRLDRRNGAWILYPGFLMFEGNDVTRLTPKLCAEMQRRTWC